MLRTTNQINSCAFSYSSRKTGLWQDFGLYGNLGEGVRNWGWRFSGSRRFLWLDAIILCTEERLSKVAALTGGKRELVQQGVLGHLRALGSVVFLS